jgi:ABC-type transport system involved in cytochrome c biogenesis permease subunit
MIDRTLKWGFFLLSIGLITGSVWAHTAMREVWSMDPKQFWAMITWAAYSLILFTRTHLHLHGRRGAILAILGSILVIITLIGTNVFYENSHNFWMSAQ